MFIGNAMEFDIHEKLLSFEDVRDVLRALELVKPYSAFFTYCRGRKSPRTLFQIYNKEYIMKSTPFDVYTNYFTYLLAL